MAAEPIDEGVLDRYPNVLRAVRETAWALQPAKLAVILDLVAFRAAGEKLSEQQIQDRLAANELPSDDELCQRYAATHTIGARSSSGRAAGYVSGTVAILPLYGVLAPRANLMMSFSGGTSVEEFVGALNAAAANETIGSILLDVNSPGGSIDMIPEAAQAIRDVRGSKPITAVANTDAASAAYWLASQADELSATPSGMVGSIGVFAAHQDMSAMLERDGVKVTLISAGRFKTEGNPYEPLSDEARQAIQETVDEFYGMFVADVAKGRSVSADAVQSGFGQGRMLTASDALAGRMVDRVETFDAAFARLAQTGAGAKSRRAELIPVKPAALEPAADKPLAAPAPSDELDPWALTQALNETLTKEK
jgi:capsid assembly protease